MGKITLLVPREDMLYQAHNILQEKKYEIHEMRAIRTEHAVLEARRAIGGGASIIIARGLQASLIKQYTEIPVVELVLTAQEMGLLVTRAKQILKKEKPVIAVVGFRNMFCDMSYFDELFEIRLRTYFAQDGSSLPEAVEQAITDQADLIIGGDTAVARATEAGVPSLFLSATEDSMRQALAMAERLDYAMHVEKKSAAQMDAILDYSFSGVIRLDVSGHVTAVNSLMEDIIGKEESALRGLPVRELAPMLGEEVLHQVLTDGKDYSLFLEWNQISCFSVIAPVLYDNRVDGAIITCHRVKEQQKQSQKEFRSSQQQSRSRKGLLPLVRFEDILQQSPAMQECIRMARLYALSQHPVVLQGESGTEKRMIAESIHNSSERRSGPFLDIPCEGLSGEDQRSMIFGEHGAVLQAQQGTLLLRDVEELTAANQYRLYQLIRFHVCHGIDIAQLRKVDVRVMVTTKDSLSRLLADRRISQDLYYLLSGLELRIPPLRCRREDLRKKIEDTIRDASERYGRFHVLTHGALAVLMDYPWYGNLFQIESFCERLILTAGKRSIDEKTVNQLLKELYPIDPVFPSDQTPLSGSNAQGDFKENREAERIRKALEENQGSRGKTAVQLGISKSTLWRKMKRFDIK